jgi:Bacterial Ig-like domain (group 3)/FG-GAP-like repeat
VTTTALSSSLNPATSGNAVVLTATVSGGVNPGGAVTFYDGGAGLGSVAVGAGGIAVLSTSSLAAGSHSISAVYGGDANNAVSTSGVLVQNISAAFVTSTTFNVSAISLNQGSVLTLTGAVSGGQSPSGTISFRDSGSVLAAVALSGGGASLSTNSLAAGYHSLTARYDGDGNNGSSTSAAILVNIIATPRTGLGSGTGGGLHRNIATGGAVILADLLSDFNGDGRSDIFWRNSTSGENYVAMMDGAAWMSDSAYFNTVPAPWKIAGYGDFDGDGKADVLWRNSATGENYAFLMDGTSAKAGSGFTNTVASAWSVAGTGDFNGDGKADVFWRNATTGENYVALMDGAAWKAESGYFSTVAAPWVMAGLGDFDGDGKTDLLWRNQSSGATYVFLMDGTTAKAASGYSSSVTLAWSIAGVGDFDGDGKADILWRNTSTGDNYISFMNGLTWRTESGYSNSVATQWSVAQIGDFDGDGRMDILWRNIATGENYIAFMNGTSIKSTSAFTQAVSPAWAAQNQP